MGIGTRGEGRCEGVLGVRGEWARMGQGYPHLVVGGLGGLRRLVGPVKPPFFRKKHRLFLIPTTLSTDGESRACYQ